MGQFARRGGHHRAVHAEIASQLVAVDVRISADDPDEYQGGRSCRGGCAAAMRSFADLLWTLLLR